MKTSRPNPFCFASSLAIFSLLATASVPVSAQRASAATSNATGPTPVRTTLSFSGTDQSEHQDYDRDDDGLIEVANLAQLDAMRYDLDGDGMVEDEDEARYYTAFPQGAPGMGCPLECEGYELTADLQFDTNGNGRADPGDAYWNGGAGWEPVGAYTHGGRTLPKGDPFEAVFDGSGHTIADLYIDRPGLNGVGLFGFLASYHGQVRNLGLLRVQVSGNDFVGSLAGFSGGVERCHATGRVSGRDMVGGLVGTGLGGRIISNSYAAVRVSGAGSAIGGLAGTAFSLESSYATGAVSGRNSVGGLVGVAIREVQASYATGRVSGQGAQTPDPVNCPFEGGVGGLIGTTCGFFVRAGYATGRVIGETSSGGAIGTVAPWTEILAVYWDLDTSGMQVGIGSDDRNGNGLIDPAESRTAGATGWTTTALQTPVDYSGIYARWNLDLRVDADSWPDDPWDFGTASQYPVLSADLDGDGHATWQEFGFQLRQGPALTAVTPTGRARTVLTWTAVEESAWTSRPDITYTLFRNDEMIDSMKAPRGNNAYTDTDVTAGVVYSYQVAASVQGGEPVRSARVPVKAGAANQGPLPVGQFPRLALYAGAEVAVIEVSGAFRDPEGDRLAYGATSSASGVAAVRLSASQLRIAPGAAGQAMITVAAVDSGGSNTSAAQRFRVTVWPANHVDYDADDDGLIEIRNLAQLDAVRHDLNGDGVVDGQDGATGRGLGDPRAYEAAFPQAVESMGCGHFDGCIGYELAADLDFDTNGNHVADEGDAFWNGGTGWVPIGGAGSAGQSLQHPFRAAFDGNGHVIANLFIDTDTLPFAALFGFGADARTSRCVIRHVGLVDVDLKGNIYVAALIGKNWGCTVTGSYATGRVSGSDYVAGLVAGNSDTITRSYANVQSTGDRGVAGLVAENSRSGIIAACYATGHPSGGHVVGGLVAYNGGAITASYATGRVRGQAVGGGLVATGGGPVAASYWDRYTTGLDFGTAGRSLTTRQLQFPFRYSGVYRTWNLDLDGDGVADDPWDFGTSTQYPALIGDLNGDGRATWQELGPQSREGPNLTSPFVKGLAITSNPGPDATYVPGEAIEVTVTFNRNMEVTGTPLLTLSVGGQKRRASYIHGARAALVFFYTVAEGDNDSNGVSINSNSIALQGGTIRDASGADAALGHGPLVNDSNHKVDGNRPVLQRATVFGAELTLDYNEALDESSVPPADAFIVMSRAGIHIVLETSVNGRTVTLTLDPPVARYEAGIAVSYAVPESNPIRDLAGNHAQPLADAPGGPPEEDESQVTVLNFAHFANGSVTGGSSVSSDLILVNVAPYSIHPAIYFFGPEGSLIDPEMVMDVTGDLEVEEDGALTVATAIPSLGELTISTHGRGELTTGSVQVFADGPAGGVLRFDLPSVGVAGVGASEPVRDAVFPARRQTDGINTGAAIRNLGAQPMTVTCRLMRAGEVLAETPLVLETRGQAARFIDEPELFGEWFASRPAADFNGSVRCIAPEDGTFTGVALELDGGNRIFTTLPVVPVDESAQGMEATLDFAHFANGYSISSDLVLVNVSTTAVVPIITFHDAQGGLIEAGVVVDETGILEFADDGSLTVQTAIEPLGELTVSTNGRGDLRTGSVRAVAGGPLGGVLRFNLPAVGVAGVGASEPVEAAVFPARRQEDGINTGAAIRNLEERTVTVICLLMKNGRRLDGARIILEPNGQMASFIDEPELFGEWFKEAGASDFTGSIHCATFGGGTFTGVALEMDPGNRIFTTLPVIQK